MKAKDTNLGFIILDFFFLTETVTFIWGVGVSVTKIKLQQVESVQNSINHMRDFLDWHLQKKNHFWNDT